MRLVFINHCHPEALHVCATRMREFSQAMTMLGHEVILLTETQQGMTAETTPEQTTKKIQTHNFSVPLHLATEPKGHPLIKKLRERKLPWGVRQAVIIWYFFYHKGVFTDWRTGSQLYLHPIAEAFKPDLIWATFLNTDAWNIAKDLAKISKAPWVGDIKDPWGIFIPALFRKFLANYFDNCLALSTFSNFNSNDVQKWFKSPTTVIYSGFWANQLEPIKAFSSDKINISLTGGIYNDHSLYELIQGVKIWLEGLTSNERSKVYLTYAGLDTEAVKKATRELNNLCQINLKGFIPVKELQKIHQNSIANMYIKTYRGFHNKTIELLSAGRPIICYPEEIDEAIEIAKGTNITLHSCSTSIEISEALSESLKTQSNKVAENKHLRELTWDFQAKKLENLFKTILQNPKTNSQL